MKCTPSIALLLCFTIGSCESTGSNGASDPTEPVEQVLEAFTEQIADTEIQFDMLPIPGGEFVMGSEANGPTRKVRVSSFYMGKHEVTWDEYEQWMFSLEIQRRPADFDPTPADLAADAVTRPTPPYTDMTFGMGREGHPAVCMTQLAAATYCEWLSAKTGRKYRLPTEAEWEYACRAGTTTKYSFGDDESMLGEYAWFADNADYEYQPVGKKKPNPWGLHDMHGNVNEWVQDAYADYVPSEELLVNPVVIPTELYPRTVRGGSYEDPASSVTSCVRLASEEDWKMQDPQIPQSVWYHTDAQFVGFRVVCEP